MMPCDNDVFKYNKAAFLRGSCRTVL